MEVEIDPQQYCDVFRELHAAADAWALFSIPLAMGIVGPASKMYLRSLCNDLDYLLMSGNPDWLPLCDFP